MEGVATLISGLAVVFAWRILLGIAVSAPLAFLIGTFCGPIVGFAAAVLGLAFGLMWHVRAPDGAAPFKYVPSPRICWPVKFVGLAFIGASVGALQPKLLIHCLAAPLYSLLPQLSLVLFTPGPRGGR